MRSGASTAPLILRTVFSAPVFFPNSPEPCLDLPRRTHFCPTTSLPSPARRWPPGTFSSLHKPSRDPYGLRRRPVPARMSSEVHELHHHTRVPYRSKSQGRPQDGRSADPAALLVTPVQSPPHA